MRQSIYLLGAALLAGAAASSGLADDSKSNPQKLFEAADSVHRAVYQNIQQRFGDLDDNELCAEARKLATHEMQQAVDTIDLVKDENYRKFRLELVNQQFLLRALCLKDLREALARSASLVVVAAQDMKKQARDDAGK